MAGIRRSVKQALLRTTITRLNAVNRFSRRPIVAPGGPVVSLTTFDARIELCHLTIESIARGSRKPAQLILWLDDPALYERLPPELGRLRRRGLEVRLGPSFGPHTKYFPYVESTDHFETALVTADDDIVYPRFWLDLLYRAHCDEPKGIHAYRARRIRFEDGHLAPYESWPAATGVRGERLNFALGVSGVLYPPTMLTALKQRGRAFQEPCPWADDIWLNHTALRTDHRVRPIGGRSVMFPMIPGSQKRALKTMNVTEGRNDSQLTATYSDSDLQLLRDADALSV